MLFSYTKEKFKVQNLIFFWLQIAFVLKKNLGKNFLHAKFDFICL